MFFNVVFAVFVCYSAAFCQLCFYNKDWIGLDWLNSTIVSYRMRVEQVQSFFRGWMCRRRWKQIVDLYIRSDHAESMRKRNSIVFSLVECEEDYVKQLSTLVSVFLRPLRMAASSKTPPITHDDVNSIFLNRSLYTARSYCVSVYC